MTAPVRQAVADAAPRRLSDWLLRWETILVALLVLVVIGNTAISPYFLDIYNLSDATYNFSEKAIVALAMALLIITREIDLSVAAIIALAIIMRTRHETRSNQHVDVSFIKRPGSVAAMNTMPTEASEIDLAPAIIITNDELLNTPSSQNATRNRHAERSVLSASVF